VRHETRIWLLPGIVLIVLVAIAFAPSGDDGGKPPAPRRPAAGPDEVAEMRRWARGRARAVMTDHARRQSENGRVARYVAWALLGRALPAPFAPLPDPRALLRPPPDRRADALRR